jgi:hypothetical protein
MKRDKWVTKREIRLLTYIEINEKEKEMYVKWSWDLRGRINQRKRGRRGGDDSIESLPLTLFLFLCWLIISNWIFSFIFSFLLFAHLSVVYFNIFFFLIGYLFFFYLLFIFLFCLMCWSAVCLTIVIDCRLCHIKVMQVELRKINSYSRELNNANSNRSSSLSSSS